MAEASMMMKIDSETLRSKITCGICKKYYQSPKTLACLHSYCLECLKAIASTKDTEKEIFISCPQCKNGLSYQTIDDLKKLPNAFQIDRVLGYHKFKQQSLGQVDVLCQKCITKKVKASAFCTSCAKFICDLCLQIHGSWSELSSHKTLKLSELKDTYHKYVPNVTAKVTCPIHKNVCSIYCETCEDLVCHECIVKGIHRDHEYYHLDESAKRHKKGTIQQLDTIHHLPTQLQTAITVIEEITGNFSYQSKHVEKQMDSTFSAAFQNLSMIKERKAKQLAEYVSEKMNTLNTQKGSLENMMVKTSNCVNFVTETTENNHNAEFFQLKKLMSVRMTELSEEFTKLDLSPAEEPEIHFHNDKELSEDISKSMKLSDGSVLHPASSGNSSSYSVGEVICFFIALSASFYKTKNNPMEELQAIIQSIRDGNVCPATVVVSSNGFAKLQCSFAERGRYQLNVKIGDNHISGSPFNFYINPNGSQLQKSIKSISKLQSPKAIAINSKYQMVICEESKHSVSVFGRKAKKLVSIGEYGNEKGKFNHPTGIAVDRKDYIYVVDSKNDRIQKFDPDGQYMGEYKGEKGKNTHLHMPSTIKYGPDGKLYVVDRGNCRVLILNQKLEYVYSFGTSGQGLGSLQDPWDLAFDNNGFIYITDRKQHCVLIYTATGSFRGKIGSQGQQKGKLNHPTGIAIDRFDKIYVCESGNHRVSIFHVSSEFVNCFSIGLEMVNPCGVTVDDDGFLYVASSEIVHVF